VLKFQPSFSFWPPPQFLGDSPVGLAAWLTHREVGMNERLEGRRARAIRQIIDNHHDKNGRTLERPKPADADV
jgi:hypothetical protein